MATALGLRGIVMGYTIRPELVGHGHSMWLAANSHGHGIRSDKNGREHTGLHRGKCLWAQHVAPGK